MLASEGEWCVLSRDKRIATSRGAAAYLAWRSAGIPLYLLDRSWDSATPTDILLGIIRHLPNIRGLSQAVRASGVAEAFLLARHGAGITHLEQGRRRVRRVPFTGQRVQRIIARGRFGRPRRGRR